MKKEVKTMTPENFRPYGTYITWEEIDVKNDPVNFYKEDSIVSKLSTDLCALTLQGVSPRENVVTRSEYHAFTEEMFKNLVWRCNPDVTYADFEDLMKNLNFDYIREMHNK